MKLRKQTPAKAVVVALTAGLMAALLALVRSEPRIKAASSESPDRPAVDYQRFFAPSPPPGATNPPSAPQAPHTRTRAS